MVEDLDRFWLIATTALTDWDAISLADDDGDPSHPPKRRPDYRTKRLNWCQRRLLAALDAHRRGEPVEHCRLPRDAGAFLSLPPGTSENEFEALVTD